jgi:stage IV sporulation protein FB
MSWSISLFRVSGTEVRLHLTFLLLLAWIGTAHWLQGGASAAVDGVIFILLLFGCVLLHEFGHVFAARRYGVRTPDITLLPIGGVARLERIPEKPSEELVVALAGPGGERGDRGRALRAARRRAVDDAAANPQDPQQGMFERLFWVNITLVLFNLIPAFPMDGGRVLRALLAIRLGSRRATEIAATVGQVVAFALGLFGLLNGAPLLVFVALFVWLGAASESQAVQMRELTRGMMAGEAAVTRFETLPRHRPHRGCGAAPAADLADRLPGGGWQRRLRGVLTRSDMIKALRETGP